MNRTNAPSHIHIPAYNHLAHIQARCIPPPSPEFARPSSRSSSFSNHTTTSRRSSSPDPYSSAHFAASHHNLHHNGCGVHTALLNVIRRSRSHVQLMEDQPEPEAPAYIDPSELYEPPPLPKLEGDEPAEDVPEGRHGFHWKVVRVQLKVDIAVHRAKQAMKRKVGLA